jgi:mono/diheme cytochrome c family protein
MLVERIESRILVGIVMFVGIMILIGWVAINENPRMASFTLQFEARAVERGGGLFAANCATCHGTDGLGILGRAPALNSPHLFGYDFFADIKNRRSVLEAERTTLTNERTDLAIELAEGASDRRRVEIEARLAEINDRLNVGIEADLALVQSDEDALNNSILTAVDLGYDPATFSRLTQANWGGTLDAYLYTTLVHGRGQNAQLWGGNVMAAWSQQAGGPLRSDQLRDLVAYIANWDRGDGWTVEDLLSVRQFAIVPGAGGGDAPTAPPVGTDDEVAVLQQIADAGIIGDPNRGDQLYHRRAASQAGFRLGCAGCHEGAVQGPSTDGTWERTINERLTDPLLAGYTPEQYLVESILAPGVYIVSGYQAGVMPGNYPEQLSLQDVADLLAYLRTTDPNYVPPSTQDQANDGALEQPTQQDNAPEQEPPPAAAP